MLKGTVPFGCLIVPFDYSLPPLEVLELVGLLSANTLGGAEAYTPQKPHGTTSKPTHYMQ